MGDYISGIQQIGIGVSHASQSLQRYASLFGMDTLVFDDVSEASLMTRYTGGEVYKRQAMLSLNLQGGGGFEIWQFKNREPRKPTSQTQYGDIGIYAAKLKTSNVTLAHHTFSQQKTVTVSALQTDGKDEHHFWVKDEEDNVFNVVSGNHWFQKNKKTVGGVTGAVIGVRDIDKALPFYQSLLNIKEVTYDETAVSDSGMNGGKQLYRKVLLQKHPSGKGAFGKLFGTVEIELVQCLERPRETIYQDRYWGDCGFIHLCFDVFNMVGLKSNMEAKGYAFTVDSKESFTMDSAAGRFCYVEDPDGTLMELVETHKIPIMKKFGLYLDLKKRNLENPLPNWMIRLLGLSKVK